MAYEKTFSEATVLQSEISNSIQKLSKCCSEEELEDVNRLAARQLKKLSEKLTILSAESNDGEMKHKTLQVENSHQG